MSHPFRQIILSITQSLLTVTVVSRGLGDPRLLALAPDGFSSHRLSSLFLPSPCITWTRVTGTTDQVHFDPVIFAMSPEESFRMTRRQPLQKHSRANTWWNDALEGRRPGGRICVQNLTVISSYHFPPGFCITHISRARHGERPGFLLRHTGYALGHADAATIFGLASLRDCN